MKEIIITIKDDGSLQVETKGFKGKSCIEETDALKALLGKETARELKPTYYQRGKEKTKRHLPLCG